MPVVCLSLGASSLLALVQPHFYWNIGTKCSSLGAVKDEPMLYVKPVRNFQGNFFVREVFQIQDGFSGGGEGRKRPQNSLVVRALTLGLGDQVRLCF